MLNNVSVLSLTSYTWGGSIAFTYVPFVWNASAELGPRPQPHKLAKGNTSQFPATAVSEIKTMTAFLLKL